MMYKVYMLFMALLLVNCGGAPKNGADAKAASVETVVQDDAATTEIGRAHV